MTQAIEFEARSPRHALPFLIPGQAQKELFINESLALLDMLLHPVVQGEATIPPAEPAAGDCWIVGSDATEAWSGFDASIAGWDGAQWSFARPLPGMSAYDAAVGAFRNFTTDWSQLPSLPEPSGGSVVDEEARASISALFGALRTAGVIV